MFFFFGFDLTCFGFFFVDSGDGSAGASGIGATGSFSVGASGFSTGASGFSFGASGFSFGTSGFSFGVSGPLDSLEGYSVGDSGGLGLDGSSLGGFYLLLTSFGTGFASGGAGDADGSAILAGSLGFSLAGASSFFFSDGASSPLGFDS